MVCTDPYFVQNLHISLTPQSLCCIEMFCNAFKKFERTLMVVRNINLGTWLEQKEWERWKGGNGGKFQERESATWEGGCAHWRVHQDGIYEWTDLDHQLLTSCFALPHCHPNWLPPLFNLFYAIKRSVAYRVGDWRAPIPAGHKHFSGWNQFPAHNHTSALL